MGEEIQPGATIKPGGETSEGKLAKMISMVATAVFMLSSVAATLPDSLTGSKYGIVAVVALSALVKVFTTLGYGKQRTELKIAAVKADADTKQAELAG